MFIINREAFFFFFLFLLLNIIVCLLDPIASGPYQRGPEWPHQSHNAAAFSTSLQTQRDAAFYFRGSDLIPLLVVCGFVAPVCWPCALYFEQDYVAAMEDFQQSLELKKNQPIAMLYKGLTFFHRGLLKVHIAAALAFLIIWYCCKPSGTVYWTDRNMFLLCVLSHALGLLKVYYHNDCSYCHL